MTGIVYEPMVEDTQGNYMTEEEISGAITDVVKKIKLASIKKHLESENDITKVQQLIKDRKKIEKFRVVI